MDWFKKRWQDVNSKLTDLFSRITGAQSVHTLCSIRAKRLTSLEPAVKDLSWKAKYRSLIGQWRKLDAEFQKRKSEYNKLADSAKKQQEAEKRAGKPLAGVSEIGAWQTVAIIAGAAVAIAAAIAAWQASATKWNSQAIIAQQEALRVAAEAQKAAIEAEIKKTELAADLVRQKQEQLASLIESYKQAVAAGNTAQAKQYYDLITGVSGELQGLTTRALMPVTYTVPTTTTTTLPEEEVPILQKWLGIEPKALLVLAVIGLLILGAPRIGEAIGRGKPARESA